MTHGSTDRHGIDWRPWALMTVTTVTVAVITLVTVLNSPALERDPVARIVPSTNSVSRTAGNTIRATITAYNNTVERTMTALSVALRPGETLDPRLRPGATHIVFRAPFKPQKMLNARIGARIRGGSFILSRNGEVLASSAATDVASTTLSNLGVSFGPSSAPLEYEITWNGTTPFEFRAVYRPEDTRVGGFEGPFLRLPIDGPQVFADPAGIGRSIAQQRRCISCHATEDPHLHRVMTVAAAPRLQDAGVRFHPEWIRRWLESPRDIQPLAHMPSVVHDGVSNADEREDILHFLMAQRGDADAERTEPATIDDAEALRRTGMVVFHDVGCVACHGPRATLQELPGGRQSTSQVMRDYVPIPDLAAKMDVAALAVYLENPLESHPDGRMPDMRLSSIEARAVASYLIEDTQLNPPPTETTWRSDAQKIARGERAYIARGCANCHDTVDMQASWNPDQALPMAAPLESLAAEAIAGCLADDPSNGAPMFEFNAAEREALQAFLRQTQSQPYIESPLDELAMSMQRLNCVACHRYHDVPGPEAAIAGYFASLNDADLGDEGRFPPDLTDVGGRLTTEWMTAMLQEEAIARPWMSVRMPQFGAENVHKFPDRFIRAAGVGPTADTGAEITALKADIGRELVGSHGLNCIQCHNVAGFQGTGTPGPDLAQASLRLRHDAFTRWLYDPAALRPGTRMPSFFYGGRSPLTDFADGSAQGQIDAIWAYVSQGDTLPLPDGLQPADGLMLTVDDQPIIVRTFMKDSGVRAIACGYPEQVHAAFDAERCQLAIVWNGAFLDASAAWANRGGAETNPPITQWEIGDATTLTIAGAAETARRFRGYRKLDNGRPQFSWQLIAGDLHLTVLEHFEPFINDKEIGLRQVLSLSGPSGINVQINAAGRRVVEPRASSTDGSETFELMLDDNGTATCIMEVIW